MHYSINLLAGSENTQGSNLEDETQAVFLSAAILGLATNMM